MPHWMHEVQGHLSPRCVDGPGDQMTLLHNPGKVPGSGSRALVQAEKKTSARNKLGVWNKAARMRCVTRARCPPLLLGLYRLVCTPQAPNDSRLIIQIAPPGQN